MPERIKPTQARSTQIFVIALLLLTTTNCSTEDEGPFFDNELSYTSLEIKDSFLFEDIFGPMTMRVFGDRLYVGDGVNDDSPVHILRFDRESGSLNYEKGLGRQGRGPGEFNVVSDFIQTDSLIYIYDGVQLRLVGYDPVSGELGQSDDINLTPSGRPESIYSDGNGKFVGIGLFFGNRFITLDSEGETISEHGELIEFNSDFSRRDIALGWHSFGAAHPEEPYIYIFSWHADFIEQYDTEGQLIKRIQGSEKPEPNMEIRDDWPVNAETYSYLSVDSDDDYIYALYSGRTRDDEGLFGSIIHQFDWDLNFIEAYQLDQRYFQIAAGGNGNIFTFGETDEGVEFYVYELF